MVVKPPVVSRCESVGLKGCDDLADGVILYLEGRKSEAREKLRSGIMANTPEEVRKFAVTLKTVITLPVVDQYAAPIREVVDFLAVEADSIPQTAADEGATVNGKGGTKSADTLESENAIEAYRTSTVVPAAHNKSAPCQPFAAPSLGASPLSGLCAAVTVGPLLVTDIETGAGCGDDLLVFVERTDGAGAARPRWYLLVPGNQRAEIHGAAFSVKPNERLVVGVLVLPGNEAKKDPHCSVTWASHAPEVEK